MNLRHNPIIGDVSRESHSKANVSWIADLKGPKFGPHEEQYPTPAVLQRIEVSGENSPRALFRSSIPKLSLNKFDGDPLKWADWSGMFHAIIHQSQMSLFEKITHLQQTLWGKRKPA